MTSLLPSAIIGAIVLLSLLAALAYARKAGKDAVKLEEEKTDAEAAQRILEAQNSTPRTPVDAARKLRDHSF